ncbi:MAG: hypothetical protein BAJATHORv1_60016 [Candidatus Thorarchaeota archaeon]|nr:MAG: hypothetical protein BAJATHORv1_60016 [Candidatus Thorarchaeota archaeon]
MTNYPDESLRPTNVRIRKEGAYVSFRPPKGVDSIKEWRIYRSLTYDYKSPCSKLIESGSDFDDLKTFTIDSTKTMYVDKEAEEGKRYSYYVFAVDENGDLYFPSYCVGKILEDGLPMADGGEPTFK